MGIRGLVSGAPLGKLADGLPQLDAYFNKNKLKHYLADKQIKIYGVMCIAALLILIIMAFSFSPAALTIAVLLGVVGGFLLWRRIVDVGKILASILADGRGDALPDAQEVYERMRSGLFFAMKLSPELMIMGIAFSATNITAKDTKVSWLRYEHCTPVTPLRYSAVRTTVNVILTAASAAIGILYMYVSDRAYFRGRSGLQRIISSDADGGYVYSARYDQSDIHTADR